MLSTIDDEPEIHTSTTYFAQREFITGTDGEWQDYMIRIVSAGTPQEARSRYMAGEGTIVTGRRKL